MRAPSLRTILQLAAPIVLVVIVALIGQATSISTQQYFLQALIMVTIVIGLYVFSGNSGVISLGHISFVAIGAFMAGLLTVPTGARNAVMPGLFGFLQTPELTNIESLLLAAALGAVFALIVGVPLMRLSGLSAGIATFAVLEIVHNVLRYWTKIGPGANTLSLVPQTTGFTQAAIAAVAVTIVAFLYQRSRPGRLLRAAREDPNAAQSIGVSIYRQRLWAFTLSGAIAGLGGALFVHMLGSIETEQVYLSLTFLTLAMLVIGGTYSLWGAVVGAVLISLLSSFLLKAESGLSIGIAHIKIPNGTTYVIVGALMVLFLVLRPSGLTGNKEFGDWQWRRRIRLPSLGALGPWQRRDREPQR